MSFLRPLAYFFINKFLIYLNSKKMEIITEGNNAIIGKIIHLVINLSTTLFKKYNILFNILSPIFVLLCPFLLRNKGSNYNSGELSPTCRGGGFVRRLVFKFPPKIRQPLFLQACPLRHYRIGLLSPQRYFFLKYSMHR